MNPSPAAAATPAPPPNQTLAAWDAPVLALGAWLKNCACLCQGAAVHWSALHGDLGTAQACAALRASALALLKRARAQGAPVAALAHDLHPDFYSTRLAQELAAELGLPAVAVQHHRAHIAAVLAAHGLDEPVLGLALDGFGLGSDGSAWGGELLWLHGAHWQRLGHLWPLALPGADQAARQPWRMAASALHACAQSERIAAHWGARVGKERAATVAQMLARGLNSPPSSSLGRWFDAAAAALDLCWQQDDEAQAAVALERAAQAALDASPDGSEQRPQWSDRSGERADRSDIPCDEYLHDFPPLPQLLPPPLLHPASASAPSQLDLRPLWLALFDAAQSPQPPALAATDAAQGTHPGTPVCAPRTPSSSPCANTSRLAAAFHLRLADGLADWVLAACAVQPVRSVALAGGCFYNRILSQRLQQRLSAAGLRVYRQTGRGCGDAGLALGQAWVAAQELGLVSAAPAAALACGPAPALALQEPGAPPPQTRDRVPPLKQES